MLKRFINQLVNMVMLARIALNPFPKLIYIVEDNVLYAQLLKSYLSLKFPLMKVVTFTDGEKCLTEIHRNPTVIIMDHMLDALTYDAGTGLSTIEKIKKTSLKSRIILLSIETDLDVFVKSLSLYDCTYIRKDSKAFPTIEHYVRTI